MMETARKRGKSCKTNGTLLLNLELCVQIPEIVFCIPAKRWLNRKSFWHQVILFYTLGIETSLPVTTNDHNLKVTFLLLR